MDAREAIRAQFMVQYMKKDFAAITVKGLCYQGHLRRSWALAPDSSREAWADEQMK
jgi:hypothetical protein